MNFASTNYSQCSADVIFFFLSLRQRSKIRFTSVQSHLGHMCVALFSYLYLQGHNTFPSLKGLSKHIMHAFSLNSLPSISITKPISKLKIIMSEEPNGRPEEKTWPELKIPELLFSKTVREIHEVIENEWDNLRRSACQMAAGRALWKHVVCDELAELFAGETYLKSFYEKITKDCRNNAREISGVILAVRTLWFDSKIKAALDSFEDGAAQVVLLGAGMDSRAYRLSCLRDTDVFEVDFPEVLQTKKTILEAATESTNDREHVNMTAKSIKRVAADITDNNWLQKLQISGFVPQKNTVWVLEGILYYLSHSHAMEVLKIIADNGTHTRMVLLADFMNKPSTKLNSSTYTFYSDWPDHLLPTMGFSDVKLSQLGDPDAHFGLLNDPLNLFNKIRNLPRSLETDPENGRPCCRLYLVQASGSPSQTVL